MSRSVVSAACGALEGEAAIGLGPWGAASGDRVHWAVFMVAYGAGCHLHIQLPSSLNVTPALSVPEAKCIP